jgi:chromosome segregation ATPase
MSDAYQQCKEQVIAHRKRQEELAKHVNDVVEELDLSHKEQQRIKREYDAAGRKYEDDLRKERRALEGKEATLQSTLASLDQAQSDLMRIEKDYNDLQSAHKEAQSRGDSQIADRFALQLQSDRLERDVQRLEDDLRRCRKDLEDREDKIRDKETIIDNLHIENRELTNQLATQTQARLNIAEKLDHAQGTLKSQEAELVTFKSKLNDTESALTKSQRGAAGSESQFRDQLTERNTLLLTIYQYLDKIVGVDKTVVSCL